VIRSEDSVSSVYENTIITNFRQYIFPLWKKKKCGKIKSREVFFLKMMPKKTRDGLNTALHALLVLALLTVLVLTAYMQDREIVIQEDEYRKIVTSTEVKETDR